MDNHTVSEMQQNPNPSSNPSPNPNPNSDFSVSQNINYSASYPHNLNSDPYQPPSIDPHNALFLPLPRPPVVDLPYVLPPVAVNYAQPPALVQPPAGVQPLALVQPQQVAGGAATSYYPDPNLSWAVAISQFGSTTYAVGVTTPNPPVQSQGRNTWIKGPKKTKVVQSAWCEVCKIDCNSKNVLDQHLSGKKHKKNLEKLNGTTTTTTSVPGLSIVDASPVVVAAQLAIPDASPVVVAAQPAIPDASPAIAAPQPAITDASPAIAAPQPAIPDASPAIAAAPPAITDASPAIAAPQPAIPDASPAIAAAPLAITDASPAIAAAQPAISDASPAILAPQPAIPAASPAAVAAPTPLVVPVLAPTDKPIVEPEENPDKPKVSKAQKARKKAASREDLETKRRKMLEGGASADAVRACSICNVVCNSETVFNYHLAGQKHASMLKKQTSMAGVASAV